MAGGAGFGAFLLAQYRARHQVEAALDDNPPLGLSAPPRMTDLLARDLAFLGLDVQPPHDRIAFASAAESLGAAWVLAGSSMGNRAMLTMRRKAGLDGPHEFLSDQSMTSYFQHLLQVLSRDHSAAARRAAAGGALRTFALFEAEFASLSMEQAA